MFVFVCGVFVVRIYQFSRSHSVSSLAVKRIVVAAAGPHGHYLREIKAQKREKKKYIYNAFVRADTHTMCEKDASLEFCTASGCYTIFFFSFFKNVTTRLFPLCITIALFALFTLYKNYDTFCLFCYQVFIISTKRENARFVAASHTARCPSNAAATASLQKRAQKTGPLLASPFHLLYTHALYLFPFCHFFSESLPQQVAARYDSPIYIYLYESLYYTIFLRKKKKIIALLTIFLETGFLMTSAETFFFQL